MKKYEYKIIKTTQEGFWDPKVNDVDLTSKLNTLGKEGCEMVSAVETNSHQGSTKEIVLFFKRETAF
ncbi:MAG: DUF4177 domain-containing protein [Leadbetterella sp.]|nr:DUF4177 domain-containing protein [Leadbetterella sp.]